MRTLAYAAAILAATAFPAVQAAGPLDPSFFYESPKSVSALPPNPSYPTCLVVIDYTITNSSSPSSNSNQPTAEPVPTVVLGNLSFQIASLQSSAVQVPFQLLVDVLQDVNFTSSSEGSILDPLPSNASNLHRIPLNSTLDIGPNNSNSVFLNATISAGSQDILPRAIFLQPAGSNPGACSLSLRSEHRPLSNPFASPSG